MIQHDRHLTSLQNTHISPLLTELCKTLAHSLLSHQILHDQQVKLFAKRQEMREERVEMCFNGQVNNLLEMGVVEMGEYPEKVFVDVFGGVRE